MLLINVIILLAFLGGAVYSAQGQKEWMKSIDKKEHKLYFLYPFADCLIIKLHLNKILYNKHQITESMKAIYITNKPELIQKLYWYKRISNVFAIVFLFNLFSIMGQLETVSNSILLDGKYLMRPDYGEGNTEVELEVTLDNTEDNTAAKNTDPISKKVTIPVKEREYAPDKLEAIFEEAEQFLKVDVLGDNEASEAIYEDLHFCTEIPGTSITVEWKPEDNKLIQSDGTVANGEVEGKGILTSVTAVLIYLEQKKECQMTFRIMPKQYSEEELLQNNLEDEITAASEKTADKEWLELPASLEKYQLIWKEKEVSSGAVLLLLGLLAAIIVWIMGDKELEKQMKQRKEQMRLDYPEIINKFTLLVNAGMTVKQAWVKISEDYHDRIMQNQSKKRYAYEEMLTTVHELKLGIAENVAYEQYGRRIGLISYIKFSSLISQNLKKGNKGFTELLRKEAVNAFEERKETAKRLGEEAGTKLLIPMMLMLIIVFLIILIPAFWTFQM